MYNSELPSVLEKSKRDHYSNYFKKNIYIYISGIKKIWKGIKSIILLNQRNTEYPQVINEKSTHITKSEMIAKSFKNWKITYLRFSVCLLIGELSQNV